MPSTISLLSVISIPSVKIGKLEYLGQTIIWNYDKIYVENSTLGYVPSALAPHPKHNMYSISGRDWSMVRKRQASSHI